MGWTKFRDRVTNNIDRETRNLHKNVNAEINRVRSRLAVSPDRAVSVTDFNAASASTSGSLAAELSEAIQQTVLLEETSKETQLPCASIKNPLNLKPGLAFIINHNSFENSHLNERKGSDFDLQQVEDVLKQFQMPCKTVSNGALSDVKLTMAELKELDFSQYACMMLFIMSHGFENNIIAAKDGLYSFDRDILYPILSNNSLVGKPKLLFVQSCKGDTDLAADSGPVRNQPTEKPDEILIFNSCVEGYCSYRRYVDGSFFIRNLCENLKKFGDTEDIREICNKVIEAVRNDFHDFQIPMIHTTITKPFVLGHYKT